MTARTLRNIILCAALVLGGCATQNASMPPAAGAKQLTAAVTLSIQIPTVTSARQRRPAFLSGFVKSVSVKITGPSGAQSGPFVGNCSTGGFCSQTVDAPIGQDTFAVSLYDALNATGNLLSSGSATATIAAGQSNTVTITFNPVVGPATTVTQQSTAQAGIASSIPLVLIARDPDGATIASPGTFETPGGATTTISIALNDPSGHFALHGTTSYTAPQAAGALTLAYDGALLKFTYPQLTVLQDGTPIATVPVTVLPAPVSSVPLVPFGDAATSLAEGPDGNVWFTASKSNGPTDAEAGRYAVASAVVSLFPLPNPDANPNLATAGGDGGVWFFEQTRTRFGRIDANGTLQEFAATFQVSAMTKGPDGNVWFLTTQSPPQIGKITPAGSITTYVVPNDGFEPRTLTAAAGRLWMLADNVVPNGGLASIATDGTGYTVAALSGVQKGSVGATMYFGKDGNFYLDIPSGAGFAVYRVAPAGSGTTACQSSSRNGFMVTTMLDDGTIVFGSFSNSFGPPVILAIQPTGTCRVVPFPLADPIDAARYFSGASDGFLYVYSTDQTLKKYGF
jgi:hypothetical protein